MVNLLQDLSSFSKNRYVRCVQTIFVHQYSYREI